MTSVGPPLILAVRELVAGGFVVYATLDEIRESVASLEETGRIARRVLGGAHPITGGIEAALREARAALRAREDTQP